MWTEQKGMSPLNRIKDLIRSRRIEAGITQQILAELLGCTQQAVQQWESGRTIPDISLWEPIAEVLHFPVEDFLEEVPGKDTYSFTDGETVCFEMFKSMHPYYTKAQFSRAVRKEKRKEENRRHGRPGTEREHES